VNPLLNLKFLFRSELRTLKFQCLKKKEKVSRLHLSDIISLKIRQRMTFHISKKPIQHPINYLIIIFKNHLDKVLMKLIMTQINNNNHNMKSVWKKEILLSNINSLISKDKLNNRSLSLVELVLCSIDLEVS
jgi:hypothetical protein